MKNIVPPLDRGVLRPGDRAIVIREHCVDEPLGKIVTVGTRTPPPSCVCHKCFGAVGLPLVNILCAGDDGFWPIAWLRKLPEVSEDEHHEEEITA